MNILKRLLHLGNAGELETVFNHNITEDELIFLGITDKEKYLSRLSKERAWRDIAYIYWRRGKERKAKRYINKTKDYDMINSFWRIISHYECMWKGWESYQAATEKSHRQ